MNESPLGTILVVEDDEDLRFLLEAHLRAAGYAPLVASNGPEGIDLAAKSQPDVIIMDVGLPSMDGVAATRALKNNPETASIPIVMLTGHSRTEDVVRGLEAGAQEYLCKPFDLSEFLARVQTVHKLARAHQSLDRLNSELEAEVGVMTARLQVLYEFMRDLNQADSRDRVLDLIVQSVQKMTGAKRISLLMSSHDQETLACERAIGIDPSIVESIRLRPGDAIAGQVFRSGKTLAARALHGERTVGDNSYPRENFVSTPLTSTSLGQQDQILGVINVTEKSDDSPFSDEEIDGLRSIADAATIALDNLARQSQLVHSVQVLLRTVGHLAEYRDEETTRHLERVAGMARILADEVRKHGPYSHLVDDEFLSNLVLAAPLHDIGKVGIPDDILTKPGKLTDEEFQIMKTHTDIGRRVLSQAFDPAYPVPLIQMCLDIAYCHHERFDGRGYPRRIRSEEVPLAARMVTLVDAYDAITSHRRYSSAKPHAEAVDIIRSDAGSHFDPVLVEAFLRCHEQFDAVRARFEERDEQTAPIAT